MLNFDNYFNHSTPTTTIIFKSIATASLNDDNKSIDFANFLTVSQKQFVYYKAWSLEPLS